MSLDGKIATRSGDSRWISGQESRAWVHECRGKVDAVAVGAGTLVQDDPLLTARPTGRRVASRIVIANEKSLPLDRQLFVSLDEDPYWCLSSETYAEQDRLALESLGVEVLPIVGDHMSGVLDELGRRRMTNVLVEGGGKLLGRFFDSQLVDEAHLFIAPKLIGGVGHLHLLQGTELK